MAIICPTVTALEPHQYRAQIERIADFAKRIHIDLMDGIFAPTVSPAIPRVWWPHHTRADIHLMYQRPDAVLGQLLHLQPSLVIIHAEAEVDHAQFAARLHAEGISVGLALLQRTSVGSVEPILGSFDHVLIFSGNLGHHGGVADLNLLEKVHHIRALQHDIEIAWDGGITLENAKQIAESGVQVLNIGAAIQQAENPLEVYERLGQN